MMVKEKEWPLGLNLKDNAVERGLRALGRLVYSSVFLEDPIISAIHEEDRLASQRAISFLEEHNRRLGVETTEESRVWLDAVARQIAEDLLPILQKHSEDFRKRGLSTASAGWDRAITAAKLVRDCGLGGETTVEDHYQVISEDRVLSWGDVFSRE